MELELITFTESFYQSKGYSKIQVPWTVEAEVMDITRPQGKKMFDLLGKQLVASAEQSFLQLIKDQQIAPGKYVATTPCFRDDREDELHQHYFLKTELINFDFQNKFVEKDLDNMINEALELFAFFLPVQKLATSIGFDIVDQKLGIELGSYGIRDHQFSDGRKVHWVYGTGMALPRLTYILGKVKKPGYHERTIPKTLPGSFFKILEETEEAKDAYLNKNPIMLLCELADLYGAMELFLEQNYSGVNMDDIKKMQQVTRRAFKNGRR